MTASADHSAGPGNPPAQKLSATSSPAPRRGSRPNPAIVLTAIGVCSVVLGGLVAAVTGPWDLAHGSWLAAYLVLVGGVTQCAMGLARMRRPEVMQLRGSWTQIGCWNVGNAVVIGGTLAGEPLAVDFGSALLVIALAIAFRAARPGAGTATRSAGGGCQRWSAMSTGRCCSCWLSASRSAWRWHTCDTPDRRRRLPLLERFAPQRMIPLHRRDTVCTRWAYAPIGPARAACRLGETSGESQLGRPLPYSADPSVLPGVAASISFSRYSSIALVGEVSSISLRSAS